MVFVELTPFVAFRRERWTDEDLLTKRQIKVLAELMKDMKYG